MLVVDASVLTPALAEDGDRGARARARLRGRRLAAPAHLDIEVMSALRGLVRGGLLDRRRAELAVADLAAVPVERVLHAPLLTRCWQLRDNLTAYDAAYIALAEAWASTLVTADARLAAAPGLRCEVEVVS